MQAELQKRGGSPLAISVDTAADSKRLAQREQLAFPLLADSGARVIREYGLVHEGAGLGAPDIAIPAEFLLDRDRRILWRFVASRVPDRADPEDVLQAIHKHWPAR